jgi:hypothetical protein
MGVLWGGEYRLLAGAAQLDARRLPRGTRILLHLIVRESLGPVLARLHRS